MSENLRTSKKISKDSFKLKKDENGVILTVHHTVPKGDALVRVRMVNACFSQSSTQLVAVDSRGNIFVFDLATKKFWRLSDQVPKSSVMRNSPHRANMFLIGTKTGHVAFVNVETGTITSFDEYCTDRIENISFPGVPLTPEVFLIHSHREAVLIDVETRAATHRLEFDQSNLSLKFVAYLPSSDRIFTCFTNDSVHIWSGVTLNTIRTLHPIRTRDKHLKATDASVTATPITEISFADDYQRDVDFLLSSAIKDYSNGLINSVAFSPDGCHVCLTTIDNYLILLTSVSLELFKLIRLKEASFAACCFLPKPNNLMLFGLTTSADVVLVDCNDAAVKAVVHEETAWKLRVSPDGKLLAIVLTTGEVNVHLTSVVFNLLKATQHTISAVLRNVEAASAAGRPSVGDLYLDAELKRTLTKNRLLPILREFGHYPDHYRHLIWCSLIDLPCNKAQFAELARRPTHASAVNLGRIQPTKDKSTLRQWKKILSCLMHWTRIFGHCKFLPQFVQPFLKVFPHSPLLTFELLASVLLNQCQLWFEFHPMEPANYLGMCENILTSFDAELAKYFASQSIPPTVYAWPLLSTAFAEVLDEQQWLHLWDNVVSRPSYYLVFCVVAFNILSRCVLMRLQSRDAIEDFFCEQSVVDVRKLVKKANYLMDKCPGGLHPKRYMKEFEPLPKGCYPKLENYPKKFVEQQDREVEELRLQQRALDERIRELEKIELTIAQQLEEGQKKEEYDKRLQEVEKLYQQAITREEERTACQRKMLLLCQKEIRQKRGKVLEQLRQSAVRRKLNLHKNELETLMRDIERGRIRDEADLLFAEEAIKENESNLLAGKHQIDSILSARTEQPLNERYKDALEHLQQQKRKLTDELREIGKDEALSATKTTAQRRRNDKNASQDDKGLAASSGGRIQKIEEMLEQIQIEFLRTIAQDEHGNNRNMRNSK